MVPQQFRLGLLAALVESFERDEKGAHDQLSAISHQPSAITAVTADS
jgi:hypothetical protein